MTIKTKKEFILSNEEKRALEKTQEILYTICQEAECEECPMNCLCEGNFDPAETIKRVIDEIGN